MPLNDTQNLVSRRRYNTRYDTPSGHHAMSLLSPVRALNGVGERVAERLAHLGITTIKDLLFHLPARYQDRTRILPIGSLQAGCEAVIQGEVLLTEIRFGRRRMLLSRISDGTGSLTLRFFHFSAKQKENLARGTWIRCYGEVRRGGDMLEMVHPEYRHVDKDAVIVTDMYLTPIYPTTEGVRQPTLRSLVQKALDVMAHESAEDTTGDDTADEGDVLQELLPREVLASLNFPLLKHAVQFAHLPSPQTPLTSLQDGKHPMIRRLSFEELLVHQLSCKQLREKTRQHTAPSLAVQGELMKKFVMHLPFVLTGAQRRVIDEVVADLARRNPMQRLVQGDVGCGKTVVAAATVLNAIEAGHQVAVMAPTELLAEQHYRNFTNWLQPLGIEVAWLSGRSKGKVRLETLERISSGAAAIVIGTHALIQDDVSFARLGYVVIDEQHRFGVHQRLTLREKGKRQGSYPHQLIMTATPIPRTLAMTAYADLDISVIDELPPGRQAVTTVIVPDARRDEVLQRVQRVCSNGRQCYWVCTLIEESEYLQCQAASDTAEELRREFPQLSIGLIHGRIKSREKERLMADFKAGQITMLVATTVVEVGVDVPNASLMIIENAERLGLAQMHQLRGRIGRGSDKSACILMYHPPLSRQGKARLAAMRDTTDGFEIARRDMELRGPGEMLGTRQAGLMQFRVADLLRDQDMVPEVSRTADLLLSRYPERAAQIVRRWLGDTAQYGNV